MAGGAMHTPHPTAIDPSLTISYRNHQKSLTYFSHLELLVLFFFTKRQSQKIEGGMAQCLPPLNTLLDRDLLSYFPRSSRVIVR